MILTRAYHFSVFAVAFWGFTALLLTGEFSEALLAVCYALTGLAYLLQRRGIRTPDIFWNGLTLIAFGVTVYLARQSLLDAAIYFFMYLLIAKLFTLRRPSDARWVYLVVFFQMVGAAVLTTSLNFALVFTGYVALMSGSLILFTLYKEQERARNTLLAPPGLVKAQAVARGSHATEDEESERSALRGVARVAALGSVVILICSVIGFALVPRLSTQKLFQGYGKPPEKPSTTAFDEAIEFGSFGTISLDTAVAMYVRPVDMDKLDRPSYLRLRGVALDTFDGRSWKRTTTPFPMTLRPAFAPFTRKFYPEVRNYVIIQPPGVTNYLFGDTFPESIRLPQEISYLFDPLSNSAWLPTMLPKDLQYTVTSRVERLESREDPGDTSSGEVRDWISEARRFASRAGFRMARSRRAAVAEHYLDKCLAVPETLNANRIRALAQEWVGTADTPFRKARAIEERFRTTYGYTLEQKARGNFIEDFLFNVKEGHCEYFATSMAVMLRTLGIPTRVVNGYYSTEWNNIGHAFTVRQRDAHSWVEVYLGDDYGWMTFDPTPPSGVGRSVAENSPLMIISHLFDAVKVRWYRYVIDYNYRDQIGVIRGAIRAHQSLTQALGSIQIHFFGSGSRILADSFGLSVLLGGLVLVPFGLLAAAWLLWRLIRGAGRNRKRRAAETAIRFYRDIVRQLARRGFTRLPGQTPREFAAGVTAAEPDLQAFAEVTELYYATRFRGINPSPQDLAAASEFLRQLKRRKRPPAE